MTLAVEVVSAKIVDIVAVTNDRVEEKIDDRLVTVDSSATASQKHVAVWLPFLNFWSKSGLFSFFCSYFGSFLPWAMFAYWLGF